MLCVHERHTLSDERGDPTRRVLVTPVAVGARVAPPVELALLGQREGMVTSSSHSNEASPHLRQGLDLPGQHLALLHRAVAEVAIRAVTK